jgi:hypothetical protein
MAEVALKGANRALTTQAGASVEKVAVEDILPKILPEVSPRTPFIFPTPKTMAMDVTLQANKNATRFAHQIAEQARIAEQAKALEPASKQELGSFVQRVDGKIDELQAVVKPVLETLVKQNTPKETPEGTFKIIVTESAKLLGLHGAIKMFWTAFEIVFIRNTLMEELEELRNSLPSKENLSKEIKKQIDELNNHHSAKHLNGLFDHNFLAGLDKDIALPDYWRIKVQDLKEIIRKQEDILASNFKVFWYTSEEIAELKTEIEERKKTTGNC